jgi:predicted AlkP superfamily pyrophosphatase or phosphodiesterase
MRKLTASLACFVLTTVLSACQQPAPPAAETPGLVPKAVFIIVDGIPADVIESLSTPALDDIAAHGGYTRAWVGGEAGGESESPTVSAVGYMSLITGTWSNKHNVYDNDVNDPDYRYWDIFRIAKAHNSELRTAIFSTWTDNRTKLLGDGLPEAGGTKLDFHADGYELDTARFPQDDGGEYIRNIDDAVATEAARHVLESGPDLSWVYLEYTDWISHEYGDSPEFADAVTWTDELVGRIWSAILRRQAANNEDWLIVVTTDHGRAASDGRDHGGQSERERTTWMVTNSNRLNAHFAATPAVVDILPSIATHLKLDMPDDVRRGLDGQTFID